MSTRSVYDNIITTDGHMNNEYHPYALRLSADDATGGFNIL